MAADPFDALRLTLMQDVLPVGLAVVERARKGGPAEVLAAFNDTSDPLGQLREEGEPVASQVREGLDRVQPGLGNPVMKVEVRDVPTEPSAATAADDAALARTLERISGRLRLLEQRLEGSVS
ncbi:hypothetical protein [Synechococcus sp. CS-1328]|uniref:hypothetical protein n=1 Tax=Synechococcus sp. CS-1328 TaxID=2847976 RepID=UPI00223B8C1B|nr:hypothetical protein [Synechococcus sp. CS-1328]MCT0224936.1 hypothetical protein [Synechococcus sp. CS-1328]